MPTETLPLIATVEDLEERVGTIDEAARSNAESLLRYASSLVRAYGNRRWDDTDGNEIPAELVEVVVGMVERARDNPAGATQDATGPFMVAFGPRAADRVYLIQGDKQIIRSVAGGGAFTIDPTATQEPGTFLGGGSFSTWDFV